MQPWRKVKYKIERNKYETNRWAGANSYIKISHTFKTKRVQDKRIKKLWNGRAFTWDFLIIQQRSHAVLKFQTFMAVRQSATTRRRAKLFRRGPSCLLLHIVCFCTVQLGLCLWGRGWVVRKDLENDLIGFNSSGQGHRVFSSPKSITCPPLPHQKKCRRRAFCFGNLQKWLRKVYFRKKNNLLYDEHDIGSNWKWL